jgi:hypothetical protein
MDGSLFLQVILDPDAAQYLHSRDLTKPVGSSRGQRWRKAGWLHLPRSLRLLLVALLGQWETVFLRPGDRTDGPTRGHCARSAPFRNSNCQTVQGRAQRFSHAHQTIERTNLGQNREASKPGSVRSRARAYFQSIRPRTASAACRSGSSSANCMMVIKASREASLRRMSVMRKQMLKGLILINGTKGISALHMHIPVWIGCPRSSGIASAGLRA